MLAWAVALLAGRAAALQLGGEVIQFTTRKYFASLWPSVILFKCDERAAFRFSGYRVATRVRAEAPWA